MRNIVEDNFTIQLYTENVNEKEKNHKFNKFDAMNIIEKVAEDKLTELEDQGLISFHIYQRENKDDCNLSIDITCIDTYTATDDIFDICLDEIFYEYEKKAPKDAYLYVKVTFKSIL